jgi:hypothetical protein
MPLIPPVTSATFPSSLPHGFLLLNETLTQSRTQYKQWSEIGTLRGQYPNRCDSARRACSKPVHSSPSCRPGNRNLFALVSRPTYAASTMSSVDMTIDADSFCHGRSAISQARRRRAQQDRLDADTCSE